MKQFLWKIYAYRFLDAFKLVGVIFTLLFQHNGLTTFEISLLITIWSVTQLVLEVPLGVFADTYSRRNLLVAALVLLVIGYLFWLQGGFMFYALGFILWGAKNALTSGTLEAFVYDELKALDKVDLYEKVNGKMEGAFWAGVTCSAVLGGLVAAMNYQWVIIASIITTIFGIITLLTIRSVKPVKSTGETKYFIVLKEALREIKNNVRLLEIILFFCLVFAVYGAADEYWALIYQSFNIPVALVGAFVAVGYGLFTLAGYTIHFFDDKKVRGIEYMLLIVSAVLFIFIGLGKSLLLLPLVFIAMYLFKIAHIKFDVKFQHAIQADQRATISSLKSLFFEIIYMSFVLLFGFVSTQLGVPSVLYLLGGFILLWTAIFKIVAHLKNF